MPKGVPSSGFRKTKKYKIKSAQELERDIQSKAPYVWEELIKYVKPFHCPHCGNEIQVIDKEVAMYMLDRALGKPKQKQELDITQTIQLDADQIDRLLETKFGIRIDDIQRYLIDTGKLLKEGNYETQET